jgi:hypothetical protein
MIIAGFAINIIGRAAVELVAVMTVTAAPTV